MCFSSFLPPEQSSICGQINGLVNLKLWREFINENKNRILFSEKNLSLVKHVTTVHVSHSTTM
jgi:hypothetical protein